MATMPAQPGSAMVLTVLACIRAEATALNGHSAIHLPV
jgi:hypothetical protein